MDRWRGASGTHRVWSDRWDCFTEIGSVSVGITSSILWIGARGDVANSLLLALGLWERRLWLVEDLLNLGWCSKGSTGEGWSRLCERGGEAWTVLHLQDAGMDSDKGRLLSDDWVQKRLVKWAGVWRISGELQRHKPLKHSW